MYFIGSGSLLIRAITCTLDKNYKVERVFCPPNDASISFLQKHEREYSEIVSDKSYLYDQFKNLKKSVVFSINNQFILHDNLLELDHCFYNIHNGLVQKYRGIGELCVLGAIINKETEYGVTLHEILPGESVDSGPVIDQISINFDNISFESLIMQSYKILEEIFEKNLRDIVDMTYSSKYIETSNFIYTYSSINQILSNLNDVEINKYCELGKAAIFFPRLKDKIIETQKKLIN